MCGITGFVDLKGLTDIETLKRMTDVLEHRGPDDDGYYFDQQKNVSVGFGHRRLSILDLSAHGQQPMTFNHLTIAFNGEIYNFKEVRLLLEKQGYVFQSQTDTEVLLKAYHKWGNDAVSHLNGMFAIAIFDKNRRKLTLIRDRAGVKPFYWYRKNGLFMFASELKSFHEHTNFQKELNQKGLSLFLRYGYILEPHTIFNSCHKLKAGHLLEVDIDTLELHFEKYWDVIDHYNRPKLSLSETEVINKTEQLLISACEYRMVSDVPVGVFLSGGYDSSLVASMLQSERTDRIKTFSIGFVEKDFNEAHHAKKVAQHIGSDHSEMYCEGRDARETLEKLPRIWDEPLGDPSCIPTYLVSKLAAQSVKVALSADGGDEAFGGYNKYSYAIKMNKIANKIPLKNLLKTVIDGTGINRTLSSTTFTNIDKRTRKISEFLGADNAVDTMSVFESIFTTLEMDTILVSPSLPVVTNFDCSGALNLKNSSLDFLLAIDYKTYQVDNILSKVDRATMACGLEGREPLLDNRLIEFLARVDPDIKIKSGEKKYLLKEIAHKYLPKKIMQRPKMGFGIPLSKWLKEDFRSLLMHYLSESRLRQGGVFNPTRIVRLRDDFLTGRTNNARQIWCILIFELWREEWM